MAKYFKRNMLANTKTMTALRPEKVWPAGLIVFKYYRNMKKVDFLVLRGDYKQLIYPYQ